MNDDYDPVDNTPSFIESARIGEDGGDELDARTRAWTPRRRS